MARNGKLLVVENYNGFRVTVIKTACSHAKEFAELLAQEKEIEPDLSTVTPRSLKHAAITWALQNGSSIWDTAGCFVTSEEKIEKTYGHYSPDHHSSPVEAMNRPAGGLDPNHN